MSRDEVIDRTKMGHRFNNLNDVYIYIYMYVVSKFKKFQS